MNPLPRKSATQTNGGGRTTIVVGGGSGVPFHQHPAEAITSGTLDDERLSDRLQPVGIPTADADSQTESGWWAAGALAANVPASSSWAGLTIRHAENELGIFAEQILYEVVTPFRIYRRTAEIFWTAWEQIDRTFYDTRYQLVTDLDSSQVAQSGAVTPNGTANSTLTGLSSSVTSPGTAAVYMVEIDPDVTFAGAQTNIIELLVDGVAQTAQLITGAAATGYRFDGHKKWRITGLAAGSRTFTARTRNTAAGTNATVNLTHTLMTVTRVS